MYRALTWLALERGVDLDDGDGLGRLARENPVLLDDGRVEVAGHDVTAAIRTARIDAVVPIVARQEPVREVMRARQRELADEGDAVLEGRDIGRVVCPHAEVKIWLVADPSARGTPPGRRAGRGDRPGASRLDATRPQTRPADDAVELDTTHLDVDEVVGRIEQLVATKTGVV